MLFFWMLGIRSKFPPWEIYTNSNTHTHNHGPVIIVEEKIKYYYFTMHHISLSAFEKKAKVVCGSLSHLQTAARRDGWMCRLDKDTRQTTGDESDCDIRRREGGRKLQVWLHQPVLHSSVISTHQRGQERRSVNFGRDEWEREKKNITQRVNKHNLDEVAQSAVSVMWQPGSVPVQNTHWMITAHTFPSLLSHIN